MRFSLCHSLPSEIPSGGFHTVSRLLTTFLEFPELPNDYITGNLKSVEKFELKLPTPVAIEALR